MVLIFCESIFRVHVSLFYVHVMKKKIWNCSIFELLSGRNNFSFHPVDPTLSHADRPTHIHASLRKLVSVRRKRKRRYYLCRAERFGPSLILCSSSYSSRSCVATTKRLLRTCMSSACFSKLHGRRSFYLELLDLNCLVGLLATAHLGESLLLWLEM